MDMNIFSPDRAKTAPMELEARRIAAALKKAIDGHMNTRLAHLLAVETRAKAAREEARAHRAAVAGQYFGATAGTAGSTLKQEYAEACRAQEDAIRDANEASGAVRHELNSVLDDTNSRVGPLVSHAAAMCHSRLDEIERLLVPCVEAASAMRRARLDPTARHEATQLALAHLLQVRAVLNGI